METDRMVWTVPEVARALRISRNLAYELVHTGGIPSIKMGKRLLVPKAALERLLDGVTTAQPGHK